MISRDDRKRHKSSTLTSNSKFVAYLEANKRNSFQRLEKIRAGDFHKDKG
jgi:hypothetical protein